MGNLGSSKCSARFQQAKNALLSNILTTVLVTALGFLPSVVSAGPTGACRQIFGGPGKPVAGLLLLEAKANGLEVQIFDQVFRYDARSPNEIRNANGFQPNPSKPVGTLLEHVKPGAKGTSNFISFTSDANNVALFLNDNFLVGSRKLTKFPTRESEAAYLKLFEPESLAALESEPEAIDVKLSEMLGKPYDDVWYMKYSDPVYAGFSAEEKKVFNQLLDRRATAAGLFYTLKKGIQSPQIIEFRQYRASRIRGIDSSSIGIAHEKEIVTDAVPLDRITGYRRVFLIFHGNGGIKVPSPREPGYQTKIAKHMAVFGRPEIAFGPWQAF